MVVVRPWGARFGSAWSLRGRWRRVRGGIGHMVCFPLFRLSRSGLLLLIWLAFFGTCF